MPDRIAEATAMPKTTRPGLSIRATSATAIELMLFFSL